MSPDWSAKAEPVPYAKLDNPQSLNLYSYVGNNPLSRVDKDGHCSAPSVGKGQVGICVDLYIQAQTLPKAIPLGLAFGDGRGPAGNDPSASYRVELQFVVTPGKTDGVNMTKNDAGVSVAIVGGKVFSGKGGSITDVTKPTIDSNGTEHFSVNNTAINGLSKYPGAPQDTIKTTMNFAVTPDGKVGFDAGGSRTAYPSMEVYRYGGDGSAATVFQRTESGNLTIFNIKISRYLPSRRNRSAHDHCLLGGVRNLRFPFNSSRNRLVESAPISTGRYWLGRTRRSYDQLGVVAGGKFVSDLLGAFLWASSFGDHRRQLCGDVAGCCGGLLK